MTEPGHGATVTLLFVDMEGSTLLLSELGDAYSAVLRDYHRLLTDAATAHGGIVVDTAGDGLFLSFATARGALGAALAAQRAIRDHPWPGDRPLHARMGLHTGEPIQDETRLVGMDVHRAARISAAAHGGQILVSATSQQLLGDGLGEVTLLDLGEHQLKDLPRPERIFQAGAPDLPGRFPPIRSVDNWPNNLPRQMTSFVGREDVVSEALRLLPTAPMLTFVGPGGVGKTRLALEVASQFMDEAPDGAWLVDLAAITDETLVAETIATTLHVPEQPGSPILAALAAQLAERRVVIVLDNCEHLLDASAAVTDELLRACRLMRVLATSREPLGIPGETLLTVGSMAVVDSARPDEAMKSEAIRLFIDRSRAVQPGFTLDERNVAAVIQICRRLDGIPLAIELAAARVKALPPDAIAERLDDRFRLLTGGSRLTLPRHRTLRAAIDWSFDMLTDVERIFLARLSIFAGSFDIAAVEAVCAYDQIDPLDVIDLVSRLIDRSLVVLDSQAAAGRYRLLDTIRQYAAERLFETDPVGPVGVRHRTYFISWAEQNVAGMFSGPPGPALESRVGHELENLRAALRAADGDASAGAEELRLAVALWGYWNAVGLLEEARGWLARIVGRTDGEVSAARAEALTALGIVASRQGDLAAAEAAHAGALAVHRQLGSPPGIAYACSNLANIAVERGDLDQARALYEEAIATIDTLPDGRGAAFGILNLADVTARQGDLVAARQLADTSIARFEAAGDPIATALALGRAANFSLQAGDPADARIRHESARTIFETFGDVRGVARTVMFLGDIAAVEGSEAQAEQLYRESIALRLSASDRGGLATACDRLARALVRSDLEQAARLVGFADAEREAIGVSLTGADATERDALLATLDERLGGGPFAVLRAEGRRSALAVALGEEV